MGLHSSGRPDRVPGLGRRPRPPGDRRRQARRDDGRARAPRDQAGQGQDRGRRPVQKVRG